MNLQRGLTILRRGSTCLSCKYNLKQFSSTSIVQRASSEYSDDKLSKKRGVATFEHATSMKNEDSLALRILRKIPFLKVDRLRTKAAAYFLYEDVADKIDYINFFEKLDLPDTFYSWFVITELHLWMLAVRAMAEGDQPGDKGREFRNALTEALWQDVGQRVRKLGAANPAVLRNQVRELSEQLQAALIAYDEGLQSDDHVLAGAVWRRFYQMGTFEPKHLEMLVRYIRKHIAMLDRLPKEHLFVLHQSIHWDPI